MMFVFSSKSRSPASKHGYICILGIQSSRFSTGKLLTLDRDLSLVGPFEAGEQ